LGQIIIDSVFATRGINLFVLCFAVLPEVVAQIGLVGTEGTLEVFAASVDDHMALEFVLVVEEFPTNAALNCSLCVNSQVGGKLRLGWKIRNKLFIPFHGVAMVTHRQKPWSRSYRCAP
jgi:hypothetical protein